MLPRRPPRATRAQLNDRTASQLELLLPGIGSVYSARIVEHRELHGPFRSAADLARVRGLGERRAARVWESLEPEADEASAIEVEAPPPAPAAPPPAPAAPPPAPAAPPAAAPADLPHRDAAAHVSSVPQRFVPSRRAEVRPSSPRRFAALAIGGAMALALGVVTVWVDAREPADRSGRPDADATGVASELAMLREDLMTLRAEQVNAEEERRDVAERLDTLEERSSGDGAAIDALGERSTVIETQARRLRGEVVGRLVKAEDELLLHRLVLAAQSLGWKEEGAAAESPSDGHHAEE